jgi:hypothetical protein
MQWLNWQMLRDKHAAEFQGMDAKILKDRTILAVIKDKDLKIVWQTDSTPERQ